MQQMSAAEIETLSDRELLARFCDHNDEDGFRTIVERHKTLVSSVCTSVLRNHADAEDSFQAVFFILARKAKSLGGRECVGGWLHRVAFRCAVTTLRRRKRQQEVDAKQEALKQENELDLVSTRATYAALHEALDALPERYRLALILCYIEGNSCKAAAQRMKTSESAVYKRLERGRQMLRRRLAGLGLSVSPLLLINSAATPAVASAVSTATISSTIFVAMQAKLAWAKGALASVGNQASLTLAQGVMRTMMMTTLMKSACSVLTGLCIGMVSMSAMAATHPPAEKSDGRIVVTLKTAEDIQESTADERNVVTQDNGANRDQAVDPKVIDLARALQGQTVDPQVVDLSRVVQGQAVDPQVIDLSGAVQGQAIDPLLIDLSGAVQGQAIDPLLIDRSRAIQGQAVDPQVIDLSRVIHCQAIDPLLIDLSGAIQGQADSGGGLVDRLKALENELGQLQRDIRRLRRSLQSDK